MIVNFKLILILSIFTISCSKSSHNFIPQNPDKDFLVPVEIELSIDERNFRSIELQNYLKSSNIIIIKTGEDHLIHIPSSSIFYTKSPNLKLQSNDIIKSIVSYIRLFKPVNIRVSAYDDSLIKDARRSMALTKERANIFNNVIHRLGVDARLVYATGYGENYYISTNKIDSRVNNDRLTVSFREKNY